MPMQRRFIAWCLLAIGCLVANPLSSAFAYTRDGIEIWRDKRGVLNISNVSRPLQARSAQGILVYQPAPTARNATVSTKHVAVSAPRRVALLHRPRVVTRTRIFSYTDAKGAKCFTNVPAGGRRYELALQADFGEISPFSNFLMARRSNFDAIVAEAARLYRVDQALVRAVIHAESGFNPAAVSPKGAAGLMQLMPDTAQRYGVHNAFNPSENVFGGVHYLRDLLRMFGNNRTLAVAAYNAGENAVSRYGAVPPYAETANYVKRVLALQVDYQDIRD